MVVKRYVVSSVRLFAEATIQDSQSGRFRVRAGKASFGGVEGNFVERGDVLFRQGVGVVDWVEICQYHVDEESLE
jgi:hypothetical protein